MKRLIEEALLVLQSTPVEDAIPPEVLGAHVGAHVLPLRILGIVRRLDRVRSDMAEGARHRDAIRSHELAIEVVGGVVVEAIRIPTLARLLVEIGIGKQTEADDTRRLAVVGADGNSLAACAYFDSRKCVGVSKRIRWTRRIADIEPEPVPVRIRAR